MMPLQALLFTYAGMLLESPKRREQLTRFLNGAGVEVEKMVSNFTSKKGAVDNAPVDAAAEDLEYK